MYIRKLCYCILSKNIHDRRHLPGHLRKSVGQDYLKQTYLATTQFKLEFPEHKLITKNLSPSISLLSKAPRPTVSKPLKVSVKRRFLEIEWNLLRPNWRFQSRVKFSNILSVGPNKRLVSSILRERFDWSNHRCNEEEGGVARGLIDLISRGFHPTFVGYDLAVRH